MKYFLFFLVTVGLMLAGCMGKQVEADCAKDMKSEDVETRLKAARKLGDVATAEALRILMLHQDDPDYRVKNEVKKSLDKINRRTFLN
jgi:HEAT repeat protein